MNFLPPSLLPTLPPPSAPHGYPSSNTPASALARRQNFDYPTSNHPGAGSTVRMGAALGMVKEHWELTRGRDRERPSTLLASAAASGSGRGESGGQGKRKTVHPPIASGMGGDDGKLSQREQKEKDPNHRHPNQYTKKRAAAAAAAAAAANGTGGGGISHSGSSGNVGMSSADQVREKRKAVEPPIVTGTASRAGGGSGTVLYPGMASQDEYNAATAGGMRAQKRKVEDSGNANKRRKKGSVFSSSPTLLSTFG